MRSGQMVATIGLLPRRNGPDLLFAAAIDRFATDLSAPDVISK
jgi:hypothetical protein